MGFEDGGVGLGHSHSFKAAKIGVVTPEQNAFCV